MAIKKFWKNLEGIEKVSTFALAFETEGSELKQKRGKEIKER